MTLPRLLESGRYALLDIETTGLSLKTDEPVQIAFGLIDYGVTKLRGYYTLKPSVPVKYGAMQKHGFSEQKLAHSPAFVDIADEFFELLDDRTVLGWGCKKFDVPILQRMFAEAADVLDARNYCAWTPQVLDALLWDRHFRPGPGVRHRLVDAVIHYNIPSQTFHDAWHDCKMTWQVFGALAVNHPEFGALRPDDAVWMQENHFTWEHLSRKEQPAVVAPCAWCAEHHLGGPENCAEQ